MEPPNSDPGCPQAKNSILPARHRTRFYSRLTSTAMTPRMTSHFLSSIGTFRNGSRQGMQTGAIRSVLELKTHEGTFGEIGGHQSREPTPITRRGHNPRGARRARHNASAARDHRATAPERPGPLSGVLPYNALKRIRFCLRL